MRVKSEPLITLMGCDGGVGCWGWVGREMGLVVVGLVCCLNCDFCDLNDGL